MARDVILRARLTGEEWTLLKSLAKRAGISMSEFVRDLLKGQRGK